MITRIYNFILIRIYTFWLRPSFSHLGKKSHIGWRAMKLKGLKYISIIGANSVVTHDIPAYSVAAGIPAKVIKQL